MTITGVRGSICPRRGGGGMSGVIDVLDIIVV